ncbi:MAG: transglycosylase SLT domain-containing protein [Gemmatimonadota bacterium]
MKRRLVILALPVLALAALLLLLLPPAGDPPGLHEAMEGDMEGDVQESLEGMAATDMPEQARAFLATDRPWRAAQVMRTYLAQDPSAPPDRRVLAAQAEAGWGAWPEVHALLAEVPALDTHASGIGLYLLGRARDHLEDAAGAVDAYRAFLALSPPAGELEDERAAARLRLGLALIRAGERGAGERELRTVAAGFGDAAVWLDLLQADALAFRGDTAAVRATVAAHDAGYTGLRAWRARVEAAQRAGDLAAARALANRARNWASTSATRAEFLVAAGRLAIQMGDTAAGRDAFRSVISDDAAGPAPRAAAVALLAGPMRPADHLAVARVHRAQGLYDEAIEGYRAWLDARTGTAAERVRVQLDLADALFYAQRYDEVEDALRPVASRTEARMLQARAAAYGGEPEEGARIYLAVANEFAGTGTGRQALYVAAGTQHEAGNIERARDLYRQVISRYPGTSQTGLSMMRLAGIAFQEEEYTEAARLWDSYRERYPRGSSALQATYWAGRAREAAGDEAGAASLYRAVLERERDSYYALRASERLGERFWPLPMRATPAADPAAERRVAGWMERIDLLRAADFPDEASEEASRLLGAAGSDRPTRYALGEALAARGYTQRAIQLGLGLQGSGPPDRRVLRILYPFPYRTLITEEARARDLDPFIAAALIRQESMFEARIVSPAGARGLMQIMPATGRGLAEAAGLEPWDAELLFRPEINVHLGTRYVAQHMDNYQGSLPAVFGAYNAGAHRVELWQAFPEWEDEQLFTERIPFAETRGYVRILTRNRALYEGLYGGGGVTPPC